MLALLAIGIGVFAFLFSIGKIELNQNYFNLFNRQSNTLIDSNEFEGVESITVETNMSDIHIEYSNDDKYKVELYSDNVKEHSITLNTKDLKVVLYDKDRIGIFPKQSRVMLYIPKEYKDRIDITTNTGDVNAYAFKDATFKVKVTTGDIDIDEANTLDLITTTGDIKNNNVETINAKCTTGDIRLGTVNNVLNLQTTTGDIRIDTINLKESSNIQTTTGDVRISNKNNIYPPSTGDIFLPYALHYVHEDEEYLISCLTTDDGSAYAYKDAHNTPFLVWTNLFSLTCWIWSETEKAIGERYTMISTQLCINQNAVSEYDSDIAYNKLYMPWFMDHYVVYGEYSDGSLYEARDYHIWAASSSSHIKLVAIHVANQQVVGGTYPNVKAPFTLRFAVDESRLTDANDAAGYITFYLSKPKIDFDHYNEAIIYGNDELDVT